MADLDLDRFLLRKERLTPGTTPQASWVEVLWKQYEKKALNQMYTLHSSGCSETIPL